MTLPLISERPPRRPISMINILHRGAGFERVGALLLRLEREGEPFLGLVGVVALARERLGYLLLHYGGENLVEQRRLL